MIFLLEFKNVSFKYKNMEEESLKNISFKVNEGECILITGASGSGKSTVVKIINGVIPSLYEGEMKGKVIVNESLLSDKKSYEIAKMIGSVNQDPRGQFFTTDTTSELAFAMENFGTDPLKIKEKIKEVSKELNIEYLIDKDIFKISSGERQKLSVGCSISLEPKILLLDEPSSNLDFCSTIRLGEFLKELKSMGYTLIIAEHRLFYLKDIIDYMFYIKDGELVKKLNREEALSFSAEDLRKFDFNYLSCDKSYVENENEETVLNVKDVKFRNILKGVSFNAQKGEIIGLIGKNGAGKTTLGKLISRIEKNEGGDIEFNGVDRAFLVMQDVDYQLFTESCLSELKLGNSHIKETDVDEILNKINLFDFKFHHPLGMSRGQKQRLIIGVSSLSLSSLVIFDEPTSGLDRKNMLRIAELIKNMSKDKAIIVITHDIEFISNVCNRILYLDDGVIREDFNLNDENFLKVVEIFNSIS